MGPLLVPAAADPNERVTTRCRDTPAWPVHKPSSTPACSDDDDNDDGDSTDDWYTDYDDDLFLSLLYVNFSDVRCLDQWGDRPKMCHQSITYIE